jgi:hypothetical protein
MSRLGALATEAERPAAGNSGLATATRACRCVQVRKVLRCKEARAGIEPANSGFAGTYALLPSRHRMGRYGKEWPAVIVRESAS